MCDLLTPEFDEVRKFVQRARDHGRGWNAIPVLEDGLTLESWLGRQKTDQYWPNALTPDLWNQIKAAEESVEARRLAAEQARITESDEATLSAVDEDQNFTIPQNHQSAWQLYKQSLNDGGWSAETIGYLESSSLQILRRLRLAQHNPAVKGMVIGHVQSGKTANMAGLINMAADWGFNFFIVLSGTIENLRIQTEARMLRDLKAGNLAWRALSHLRAGGPHGDAAQNLDFRGNQRFFTVSLKNSARLGGLLNWLNRDPRSLGQMKILILAAVFMFTSKTFALDCIQNCKEQYKVCRQGAG
jgi:hypothetical protein